MDSAVSLWTQPSCVGPIVIAATADGVCLVEWADRTAAVARLRGAGSIEDNRVEAVAEPLALYFDGDMAALADVAVDLCLVESGFRKAVLEELARLAPGTTTTYGELAKAVGKPGGAQAVGGAVGANPIPIIIPCHRVIASNGTLGGFSGGLSAKRTLLAHEGFADLPGGWAKASDTEMQGQLTLAI